MKKPAIGVLDLGASGGRIAALVLDGDRLRLRDIYEFEHVPQYYRQRPLEGCEETVLRACWDLGRIYQGTLDGLRTLAQQDDLALRSFGIDAWGSDGAWITAAGDVLGLIGTGRDERWLLARDERRHEMDDRELFRLSGTRTETFCVLNQVYWFTRRQPAIVQAAARYMPVGSLLNYYLCGEQAAEQTWMSTTQLNFPGESEYRHEVFRRLALPEDKMPALVGPGTRLGACHAALAHELGLPQFEVIIPAVHDTAGAYAAAPLQPGRRAILVSSGTWALVGLPLPAALTSDCVFDAGLTNIGGCESVFLQAVIGGSWAAQQLRRQWQAQDGGPVPWQALTTLAEHAPALAAILNIDDPALRAPGDMAQAVADFCRRTGQAPPADRAAMIRAVYEGMALRIAQACRTMQSVAGTHADEIVIVGGGIHNRLVNRWLATATGLPVRTGPERASALGNGLIQAQALGWISSIQEGQTACRSDGVAADEGHIYVPGGNSAAWDDARGRLTSWETL